MIDPNELMLGNWVELCENDGYKEFIQIELIGNNYIQGGNIEIECCDINPISITEEILLKSGFTVNHRIENVVCFDIDDRSAYLVDNKRLTFYFHGLEYRTKYLHEVQNIYYLITKKHLNVNLNDF